jgi:hypothetical protein
MSLLVAQCEGNWSVCSRPTRRDDGPALPAFTLAQKTRHFVPRTRLADKRRSVCAAE